MYQRQVCSFIKIEIDFRSSIGHVSFQIHTYDSVPLYKVNNKKQNSIMFGIFARISRLQSANIICDFNEEYHRAYIYIRTI